MQVRAFTLALAVPCSLLAACSKDPPSTAGVASAATAPATAPATAAPPASSAAGAAVGVSLPIRRGTSTFLIDAPLEKIKGKVDEAKGSIELDPADLTRTRGEVGFKLTSLKTTTFGDEEKDSSQTEHAHNWMQVGKDSKGGEREKFSWATFRLTSVEASPGKLADAKEEGGARTIKGKATGDLTLHGVTSKKTLAFTAIIKGPADKPTSVELKTAAPFDVSLKEHDIKPRDEVGGFLKGALEKIGKKIDDRIQVSFDVSAGG